MTDGDGILGTKTNYVSGNLLFTGFYLEGPIAPIDFLATPVPSLAASTNRFGLRSTYT